MDTMAAFAMGEANRGRERKVFDWDRAAELIRGRQPNTAGAGLSQDWDYTGGTIYQDGGPVPADDTYVYLASTWATPELDMDGDVVDCYRMESDTPGWNESTYWPDTARAILAGITA